MILLALLVVGALGLGATKDALANRAQKDAPAPKLEAPERALVGRKPDLRHGADFPAQNFARTEPPAERQAPVRAGLKLAAVPVEPLGSYENLFHDASMRFDSAGAMPSFEETMRLARASKAESFEPASDGPSAGAPQAAFVSLGSDPSADPNYGAALGKINDIRDGKKARSSSNSGVRDGKLRNGLAVPIKGYGYEFVHSERGTNYATDEMGLGLMHMAADFQKNNDGHPGLRFGDASDHNGGQLGGHKSHQNGRDVDIIFLATDAKGRPVPNGRFTDFNAKGVSGGGLRFDEKRNWELVKSMLENPYFGREVQFIFIDQTLKTRLLRTAKAEYEAASGEEKTRLRQLYTRAQSVLFHEPNHADHFHLRIRPNSAPLPRVEV